MEVARRGIERWGTGKTKGKDTPGLRIRYCANCLRKEIRSYNARRSSFGKERGKRECPGQSPKISRKPEMLERGGLSMYDNETGHL